MKRNIVVGWIAGRVSSESSLTDFCSWDTLSSTINLKDYDVWVLLPEELTQRPSSTSLWNKLTTEYVYDALKHKTVIYVVGDPRNTVIDKYDGQRPFLHWTGIAMKWDSATSTLYRTVPSQLGKFNLNDYFSRRSQWPYALDEASDQAGMGASPLFRLPTADSEYRVNIVEICLNRYRRKIAFSLQLDLYRNIAEPTPGRRRPEWKPELTLGSVVVVPANQTRVADYLNDFLKECLDVSLTEEPPAWIDEVEAPNQKELDSELSSLSDERVAIDNKIEALSVRRGEIRKCVEVLYQIGPSLETGIIQILTGLGGSVEIPADQNKEDGWLVVHNSLGDFEGVLEIKGTRKAHFDEHGLRQLLDWVNRGIELRTKKYKPIFIGNSSPDILPADRANPFGSNWEQQAKLGGAVALTSSTLFDAYKLDQDGVLDRDLFWKLLFERNGVFVNFDLPLLSNNTENIAE